MPIVGFIDSRQQRIPFAAVLEGEGDFRTRAGAIIPRPILRALASNYRVPNYYGDDPNTISVTTLIAPVQQKRLEQRHDLYVAPLANLWASYGSLEHALFEEHAGLNDIVEHKLVIERHGMKIGGTFDLLELVGEGKYQGRDYKIASAYGIKKMLAEGVYKGHEDYYWQGQIYRLMAEDPKVKQLMGNELRPWPFAGKVKIDNWALCAVGRDYNARQHGVHFDPVELIDIPLLAKGRVENYIKQKIMVWQASEMADDAGLPSCTDAETWQGRRCAAYCASAPVCHQFEPRLGLGPE